MSASFHRVIIDLDDNIWTCGRNEYEQLGLGDNEDRNEPTQIANFKAGKVSAGGNHTRLI